MLALRDSSFIINTLLLLILEPFSPLHHSLSSCLLVQLGLSVCFLEPLAIFWPKLQLSEIPVSAIHFCQNSQQSNCSIVEMRCCQMSPQLYHLSTSKSFFRAVGPNNPIEGFILVPCCSLKATLQHCLVSQADIYGLDQLENSNDHGGQTQLERQPACATSHTRSQCWCDVEDNSGVSSDFQVWNWLPYCSQIWITFDCTVRLTLKLSGKSSWDNGLLIGQKQIANPRTHCLTI